MLPLIKRSLSWARLSMASFTRFDPIFQYRSRASIHEVLSEDNGWSNTGHNQNEVESVWGSASVAKRGLHLWFTDFEKAFDLAPNPNLWDRILRKELECQSKCSPGGSPAQGVALPLVHFSSK